MPNPSSVVVRKLSSATTGTAQVYCREISQSGLPVTPGQKARSVRSIKLTVPARVALAEES
jgi:hypothetical protein